jgi:hypothetical protein
VKRFLFSYGYRAASLEKWEANIAKWKDFVCTNSAEKCSSGVSAFSLLVTVSGDGVLYTGSLGFWAVSTVCIIKRTHFENQIWFHPQEKWWGGAELSDRIFNNLTVHMSLCISVFRYLERVERSWVLEYIFIIRCLLGTKNLQNAHNKNLKDLKRKLPQCSKQQFLNPPELNWGTLRTSCDQWCKRIAEIYWLYCL